MADQTVRTYDPNSIIITYNGYPITGFAEGTFVSIKRNGDMFTKSKGADGGIDRTRNNSFDFEVTVTLKQVAQANEELTAMFVLDAAGTSGPGPLTITDLEGSTLFNATQAWIKKDPDVEFSEKMGERAWVFETGVATLIVGAN